MEGKNLTLPESIQVGDITGRDGLQVLEHLASCVQGLALSMMALKDAELRAFYSTLP